VETINVHEAKTHFSKLLAKAHNGEEIIISKAGIPWAKLSPYTEEKLRKPGIAVGKVTKDFFDPLPDTELDNWE